jgi:hypothetical protein
MEGIALVLPAVIGLFAVAILAGMIVRAARAPRGARLRAAFGPIMGAGETYQELHTGQRGLQDSVIETIRHQETRPSRTDRDADRDDPAGDDTRG